MFLIIIMSSIFSTVLEVLPNSLKQGKDRDKKQKLREENIADTQLFIWKTLENQIENYYN